MEAALHELNATLAQRTGELEHRTHQLQKLTLELSQAEDRERRRIAEILHEDLQQILAAAKFNLSIMRNRVKHDLSAQDIGAEIDRMLKDAVEKSRSLSHELSPALLYQTDLAATLAWLASQVQAKHGLVVHVRSSGPVNSPSDAFKAFLYKVAQELLFNVVKHAQAREATIRLRQRGRWIGLSVCDRGRGFDPQQLEQTAGLGLLSIRERIELLGGRMKIRSARGEGSTFLVIVPDGREAEDREQRTEDGRQKAEERLPSSALGSPSSGSRLRVLLADDHEVMREGLAMLLSEQEDLEVVGQAADGPQAVALARELQPDVVVMDVSMPRMEGDKAARQIKQDRPETRVVGLSMFEEPAMVERMHQAGAEHYVLKTAPAAELLAAIRG